MKLLIACLLLVGFVAPAYALDKLDLNKRLQTLTTKFEMLQSKTDKRIPAQVLSNALGIVLFDRTKAGFIFAFQGGGGVAMVKDTKTGNWSAPAFMRSNEASLGFQVGGQQSFVVILLMTTNATRALTDSSVNFGGEASGTAGESSGKTETANPTGIHPSVMLYSDASGLYGGVSIKGGDISPDTEANVVYYGKTVTPKEILFENKVKPSAAAAALAEKITQAAK